MRLLIFNHLENALESLRANRLRTFLTITGVTIGIASITSVLSLAAGASEFLTNQAAATDNSIALIRSSSAGANNLNLTNNQSLHTTSTLTEKDATELAAIEGASAAPMALLHTNMHTREDTVDTQQAALIGTTSEMLGLAELELFDGQFLAENSNANAIVMGHQLSIDLFGTEHSLGSVLKIRDQSFTVIGVLKATRQPVNYHGVDFDNSAMIQLESIKLLTQGVAQIQQIIIVADEEQPLTPIVEQADKILYSNHHGEEDYTILTGRQITAPNNQLFSGVVTTVAIIAGISLLVGGVGIMNIMLVNVAERQREVGIRKAIGATDTNIISQFLIESAIIGFLGGICGYAIGLAVAFGLSMYLPFAPVFQWQVASLSIGTAILTGIFFGIYPAVRAAKKEPIESLHH